VLDTHAIIDAPYQVHEIPKHSMILETLRIHRRVLAYCPQYPLRAGVDLAFLLGGQLHVGLRHLYHGLGVDDKAIVVLELDLETEVAAVLQVVPS
jgi:hypothetical protein